MTFVRAATRDLPAIKKAVSDAGLSDVHVAPPYLGAVIVQCPDEKTAAVVQAAIRRSKPS